MPTSDRRVRELQALVQELEAKSERLSQTLRQIRDSEKASANQLRALADQALTPAA